MTDAQDRPMDGTEDASGPQEDPGPQLRGDAAEATSPSDQGPADTAAPLEEQLAPIVLEGEQVPAIDAEERSIGAEQGHASAAPPEAGTSTVDDASSEARAPAGPVDTAGDAPPVANEATPAQPGRADEAADAPDQAGLEGSPPPAPADAEASSTAGSTLDDGPIAAAASAPRRDEAPVTSAPADVGAADALAEAGAGDAPADADAPAEAADAQAGVPADGAEAAASPTGLAPNAGGPPAADDATGAMDARADGAEAEASPPDLAAQAGGPPAIDDATGAVDAPADGATAASPPLDIAADAGGTPPAPGAASAPVLPPPPPELADVPADAGRIVSGRVREVRGDDVLVDLDDGRVGVINRRNLGGEGEPASVVSPGDAIEGAVLARSDPQRRVVLSRTWALKKRAWEAISAAAAENRTLTGTVVSVSGKGAVVDVGVRGFVPASHLELGPVSDPQRYAGQELTLRILDVDADRERLVLSRRSVLLKEQRRSAHDALSSLEAGQVRKGKVASVSEYGAFVDIGGVTGLVHLSELSWHRVRHPSDVLSVGQEVDVKVLDVKVKKRRVSLSIRQLTDDPLSGLQPGEIRTGPVTRLVDFGAFVDLAGVEGLVHLSELAEYRVSAPEEIVAPGEQVRVKVLSVDHKRRRIELSIRQAAEYGG